jgi:cytoskeleton protein RodZ
MEEGLNAATQSVGVGLREVRERLGWRLDDVAENLRIKSEFLAAIEAGNLQALPGPAYRAGFVRSYARALGLDPDEILRRFRAAGELQDAAKTETRFITNVPDSGVPKGAAVMVGVLLLIAGYGLWFHYSGTQRHLADQVPAVPAELAPLATPPKIEVAPVTPAPSPAPAPAAPAAAAPAAQTPVVQTPAGAANPAAPAGAVSGATPAAPPPSDTAATAPATPPPGAGLVISATQDAWIEVNDPAGNILFSRVLHPGESWPVPQEPGLILTTGNAGGTVLVNNGTAGAPLGGVGVVMHNIQLTPAASGATAKPATPGAAPSASPAPVTTAPAATAPAPKPVIPATPAPASAAAPSAAPATP